MINKTYKYVGRVSIMVTDLAARGCLVSWGLHTYRMRKFVVDSNVLNSVLQIVTSVIIRGGASVYKFAGGPTYLSILFCRDLPEILITLVFLTSEFC